MCDDRGGTCPMVAQVRGQLAGPFCPLCGFPGIELKLSVMFGHPSLHLPNLSFEIKSPPEPGEFYLGCLSTKSTGSTFPCIPITGDADHPTLSVFHMDAGDPDSGLHTWAANT